MGTALGVGGFYLVRDRAMVRATDTRNRLAPAYGEGCVAVIPAFKQAGLFRCRLSGLEIGSAFVDHRWPDWEPKVSVRAIALDPESARVARIAVDRYDADGRRLGSFAKSGLFAKAPHPGEPAEILSPALDPGFPFVLALRPARPGE